MAEQLGLSCMEAVAAFSPCRTFRYTLHRTWDVRLNKVAFLMFNPSTADERCDDPTIRRCRGFAERWSYGSMVIVNLFAVRGSDPRIVRQVPDPVGPANDYHILNATKDCVCVVCAWGCGGHMKGELLKRPRAVVAMLRRCGVPVDCLGYSADGNPRHPLMLPYSAKLERFEVKR